MEKMPNILSALASIALEMKYKGSTNFHQVVSERDWKFPEGGD